VELGCFRVIFSGVGYLSVRIPACLCRQIHGMCYATRTRTLALTWYVHAHACGINKFSKPSPSLVNPFSYPIWFWPCMQVYTHACSHLIQSSIWPSVIALTEHYIYLISSICTSFLRLDKGNFDEYQDGWICSSRLHCRMNNTASAILTLSTSCFFFWRFFRETLLCTCITDMRHGPATYITSILAVIFIPTTRDDGHMHLLCMVSEKVLAWSL